MSAQVGISGVSYYRPESTYSVEELGELGWVTTNPAQLREFGFSSCAISNQSASDMAISVTRKLLTEYNVDPKDVGLLICAHAIGSSGLVPADGKKSVFDDVITNLGMFKFSAPRLQYELGLEQAQVLGLSDLGCVSLLSAVGLAQRLLPQTGKRYALCVNADVLQMGASREVLYSVISDAACAVLVDMEATGNHILGHAQLTKGFYWNCEVTHNELLAAYFPTATRFLQRFLQYHEITFSQITRVLPNNVSERSWEILGTLLGIGLEKIYTPNIARRGHSIACDNFINFSDITEEKKIVPGDLLLLFGFGLGAHWGCMLTRV